jgi:quercetin dioxygenase-like cupin family protein
MDTYIHRETNAASVRRKMKSRWALAAVLGLAGVALSSGAVHATPPSQLTQVLLTRGTNVSNGTIPLHVGTDVAMATITVQPGGSSGWHSHPGGAIIVVKEGSLTVYESIGNHCEIETYSAGQAFIEKPGEVDQVVNNGTVPYVLYVTFPDVPPGGSPRTDVPNPGTCPGQ